MDYQNDSLVLPKDWNDNWLPAGENPIWNAMMYSKEPRNPAWVFILKHVISNVQNRSYGPTSRSYLDITGPVAAYRAIRDHLGTLEPKRNVILQAFPAEAGNQLISLAYGSRIVVEDSQQPIAVTATVPSNDTDLSPYPHFSVLYGDRQVYCDEPGPRMQCEPNITVAGNISHR